MRHFEDRLGYRFRDPALLVAALTHRSAAHETELEEDYERLEFLGDAVLGLLVSEHVFRNLPDESEGELTRLKSRFVAAPALLAYALHLDLGGCLILGQGEERSGGRQKDSLLADSMEAVFSAVYLDGGLETARAVVAAFLAFTESHAEDQSLDAKSALQEILQGRGSRPPTYRVVGEGGPDHAKLFEVEAVAEGVVVGRGRGRTKKAAEREAADDALRGQHREES